MTIRLQNILNAKEMQSKYECILPMHYIMLNHASWDQHPTVAEPKEINLDNLRLALTGGMYESGMSPPPYPQNSDMWFDLEPGGSCPERWDCTNTHDMSPVLSVFEAKREILRFARSVRLDCKFGYYHLPESNQYAYTLDNDNAAWLDKMQEVAASVLVECDYAMPSLYWGSTTNTEVPEYTRRVLERIRKYSPHIQIIPFLSPWCYRDNVITQVPGDAWKSQLDVLTEYGINDIVIWGEGDCTINESAAWWIETIKLFGNEQMDELQRAVAALTAAYQAKQAHEAELAAAKQAVKNAVDQIN